MHLIQSKILSRLYSEKETTFSNLKPDTVANNIFDYHLKQLLKQKLVEKDKNGKYSLSANGLNYVDGLSGKYNQEFKQAKIISIIEINLPDETELLYRRKHQPYLGMVGLLSGKVHYGEDIKSAAARELKEKSGLDDISLVHRADVYISIFQSENILTKVLGHVFSGSLKSEKELAGTHPKGEVFWGRMGKSDVMPGTVELKNLLNKNKNFFFAEIKAALD